jgi:hypothetical protein
MTSPPNRDTVQFLTLFVSDVNRAAEIVAAVLFELPCNPGGVCFRAYQVRETFAARIEVHALAEQGERNIESLRPSFG